MNDTTGSGAGVWHITVSATTFTDGTYTLPDAGTLAVTGSITSPTASAGPALNCPSACAPPVSSQTYPVAIPTARSAPPPVTVGNAGAGTGRGAVSIGGHTAPDPFGWWLTVPANARLGSYTSTVTVAVVSGP